MENLIWCVIGVVAGIPAGILSNILFERHQRRRVHKSLRGLCGLWIEQFVNSLDGHFSLAAFYWDDVSREFRYDGTRFNIDGKAIYHWSSRSLFCDEKIKAVVYSYEHAHISAPNQKPEYGLGKNEYAIKAGTASIQFVKGTFVDRDDSHYVHMNLRRFSDVAKDQRLQEELDEPGRVKLGEYLARILRQEKMK